MIILMKKVVPQCRIVAHIICHDSMQRDRKNTNKKIDEKISYYLNFKISIIII